MQTEFQQADIAGKRLVDILDMAKKTWCVRYYTNRRVTSADFYSRKQSQWKVAA